MDTTKVQLGESMCFIGVMYGNVSEASLTGTEMIQTAVSSKLTPVYVTTHKSWEPGAYCTACRYLNRLKNVFLDASDFPNLFQAGSSSYLRVFFIVGLCLPRKGRALVNLVSFREFEKLFCCCCCCCCVTSLRKDFPCRVEWFNLEGRQLNSSILISVSIEKWPIFIVGF